MVKLKFTAPDVRAMVRDLRTRVLGMKVINIYDIDSKTYTFKLGTPGEQKVTLLMESGVCFHTTSYARERGDMPSAFAMKLRKHLRGKSLDDVRQLGTDRVVSFRFGSGDAASHVILEMYASGNLILTDNKLEVLALLRTHAYDEDAAVAMHKIYPLAHATNAVTGASDGEAAALAGVTGETLFKSLTAGATPQPAASEVADTQAAADGKGGKGSKGGAKGGSKRSKSSKASSTLKGLLMSSRALGVAAYGPALLEHCILQAGLDPSQKFKDGAAGITPEQCDQLASSLRGLVGLMHDLDLPGQPGYIVAKQAGIGPGKGPGGGEKGDEKQDARGGQRAGGDEADEGSQQKGDMPLVLYEDFLPHKLMQHDQLGQGYELLSFESFDAAVDEFFSRVEEQKLKQAAAAAEAAARAKLDYIRSDQEKRMEELEKSEVRTLQQARLVEAHSDMVEKALLVLRSALATGADWATVEDYVKSEQAAGNPLARRITHLQLEHNIFSMALEDYDDVDEDGQPKMVEVEIDLSLSAHANSRALYEAKKKASDKAQKTFEGMHKALKAAEKQTQASLHKQQLKRSLTTVRKVHWFEKFHWFITSDNYLVLSGRDAQQNEMLVKRYLRAGDAYVHADVHGAASCIVRNKGRPGSRDQTPISPVALFEAGCMTVCRSAAWKAKMVTSAWWVHAEQVSKMAPSGEYLSTGSFMIRGKKNFLAPHSLEMGLALLFKIDADSVVNHLGERKERTQLEDEEAEDGDTGEAAAASAARETASRRTSAAIDAIERHTGVDDDDGWGPEEQQPPHAPSRAQPQPTAQNGTADDAHKSATPSLGGNAGDGEAANGERVEGDDETGGGGAGRRKRLTAKERRMIKKGKSGELADKPPKTEDGEDERDNEGEEGEERPAAEGRSAQRKTKEEQEQQDQESKRGKRGKLKKIKKKYSDQDDEDRELALQALGVKPPAPPSKGSGQGGKGAKAKKGAPPPPTPEAAAKVAEELAQVDSAAWGDAWAALPPSSQELIDAIIDHKLGVRRREELGATELRALASANEEEAKAALQAFRLSLSGPEGRKWRVKSALLGREVKRVVSARANGSGSRAGGGEGRQTPKAESEKHENPAADHEESEDANPSAHEGAAAGAAGGGAGLSRRAAKRVEVEGLREMMVEEGVAVGHGDDDDDALEEERELQRLTGAPHPTDVLLFAVPVCAPYSALTNHYKYRVKLTPGTGKKGKASQAAMEIFTRDKDAAPREVELMKAINDNELVAVMLGDVKVSKPGMQAALTQAKKAKVKAAKDRAKSRSAS